MGKAIVNGQRGPVQQPPQISYDPRNGLQFLIPYEAAVGEINGLLASAVAAGCGYTVESDGAKSRVTIRASGPEQAGGGTEVPIDTWQIVGNEIQKDLFEHPTSLAIEEQWPGTLGYMKRDIASYFAGKALDSPAPDPAAVAAGGGALYYLLKRGTTHFALAQYVLRHTQSVSSRYSKNFSDTNTEKIYTTTQLLAECSAFNFPLPGRMINKINAIAVPAVRTGYLFGWRKLPSTEITSANNRVEVTNEYVLDQWSTFIYGAAV